MPYDESAYQQTHKLKETYNYGEGTVYNLEKLVLNSYWDTIASHNDYQKILEILRKNEMQIPTGEFRIVKVTTNTTVVRGSRV